MKEIIVRFSYNEFIDVAPFSISRELVKNNDILLEPIIGWLEQLNIEYEQYRPIFE